MPAKCLEVDILLRILHNYKETISSLEISEKVCNIITEMIMHLRFLFLGLRLKVLMKTDSDDDDGSKIHREMRGTCGCAVWWP